MCLDDSFAWTWKGRAIHHVTALALRLSSNTEDRHGPRLCGTQWRSFNTPINTWSVSAEQPQAALSSRSHLRPPITYVKIFTCSGPQLRLSSFQTLIEPQLGLSLSLFSPHPVMWITKNYEEKRTQSERERRRLFIMIESKTISKQPNYRRTPLTDRTPCGNAAVGWWWHDEENFINNLWQPWNNKCITSIWIITESPRKLKWLRNVNKWELNMIHNHNLDLLLDITMMKLLLKCFLFCIFISNAIFSQSLLKIGCEN